MLVESAGSPIEQPRPCRLKICRFDGLAGHSGKLIGEQVLDWLAVRLQELCHRTPVTGEISDKGSPNGTRDRALCLKAHDIEEIPRVLAIQCCAELAGVELHRVKSLDLNE